MKSISDNILMTRIARGDEAAFTAIYSRYKGLVYGMVFNSLGDTTAAEDATIEVFTRVWHKAGTFDPNVATFKTWVATIARHHAIDQLRKKRVRPDQQQPEWADAVLENVAEPADPETQYQAHEKEMLVRNAIAQLPGDQQEALALAYFKGYSQSQIAKTLGHPLGSVKTRIRKAMEVLREKFSTGY